VQLVLLKVPVLLVVKLTVPVGVTVVPLEMSATVTVQVDAWLSGTLAGEQLTVVLVCLTVNVNETDVELLAPVAVAVTVSLAI